MFGPGPQEGFHEIDISAKFTSFMIVRHYSPKAGEENTLKGGDIICLLHKELDSYIAAEGVFTEAEIVEEVHLRERYKGGKNDATTSATNANCFFQVEIDQNSISGEKIMWDQAVRLKHMTTQKYLTLEPHRDDEREFDLNLTEDLSSKYAVFRFKPVLKSGLAIEMENFANIEQLFTTKCLAGCQSFFLPFDLLGVCLFFCFLSFHRLLTPNVAQKMYEYAQNRVDPKDDDPMNSLKWETTLGRQFHLSDTPKIDDAFAIIAIEDYCIMDFYVVAGIVPSIDQWIRTVLSTPMTELDPKHFSVCSPLPLSFYYSLAQKSSTSLIFPLAYRKSPANSGEFLEGVNRPR